MTEIVRYRPGVQIDTAKTLEIIGLASTQWGPIEQAYPEVGAAGPSASFRRESNVTIFPPSYASPKLLRMLLTAGDSTHVVYRYPVGDPNPKSVLVHIIGGYASLHIWRLRPERRRNRRR